MEYCVGGLGLTRSTGCVARVVGVLAAPRRSGAVAAWRRDVGGACGCNRVCRCTQGFGWYFGKDRRPPQSRRNLATAGTLGAPPALTRRRSALSVAIVGVGASRRPAHWRRRWTPCARPHSDECAFLTYRLPFAFLLFSALGRVPHCCWLTVLVCARSAGMNLWVFVSCAWWHRSWPRGMVQKTTCAANGTRSCRRPRRSAAGCPFKPLSP